MKTMKVKLALLLSALVLLLFVLTGCAETQYEKDSKSGFKKFSSGQFSSMTEGEKKAVNDFLEWQEKNQN